MRCGISSLGALHIQRLCPALDTAGAGTGGQEPDSAGMVHGMIGPGLHVGRVCPVHCSAGAGAAGQDQDVDGVFEAHGTGNEAVQETDVVGKMCGASACAVGVEVDAGSVGAGGGQRLGAACVPILSH